MPALFYGSKDVMLGHTTSWLGKRLFAANGRPIETDVFDIYKIEGMAPWPFGVGLAHLWHLRDGNTGHTAIAWLEDRKTEQTIFLPGLLWHQDAVFLARDKFGSIVPGPLLFRFYHESEVLLWD